MTTHNVTVLRSVSYMYTTSLEASTPEEASELAIEEAINNGFEITSEDITTEVEVQQSSYNSIANHLNSSSQPQAQQETYTPLRSLR